MKLGELVTFVRKAAGGGKPERVSEAMATSYVSEAMRYVASVLPSFYQVTVSFDNYAITDSSVTNYMDIRDIWIDNVRCRKTRWDEMVAMDNLGAYGGIYRWGTDGSSILVSKKSGTAIVYGGFRPEALTVSNLQDDLVQGADPGTSEIAGITDERLALVRLRAVKAACEEAGDLERAMYFERAAGRIYRDLRESYDPNPGDHLGSIEVWDGIR